LEEALDLSFDRLLMMMKATDIQEFQNKKVVICFNKGCHYAKLNPTKIQARSMSWRQHEVHWIRSCKAVYFM